jgi:hypothetical protein
VADTQALLPDTTVSTDESSTPRLIIAVDAVDKAGKTEFGFNAPKPILYMDLDIGREGVLDKHADPRIIVTRPFVFRALRSSLLPENARKGTDVLVREKAEPELERFKQTYLRALHEPILKYRGKAMHARTIVVDTGTETWELLRLCEFGKLSQVKSHHYTEVNGLMRDLVREAFDADVNVIWLHKLKYAWKEGGEGKQTKTNTLERQGFQDMHFLVQANVLLYRAPRPGTAPDKWAWQCGDKLPVRFDAPARENDEDLGFRLRIGNCRHDPTLEGVEFSNEMVNFRTIAGLMMPQMPAEVWEDTPL